MYDDFLADSRHWTRRRLRRGLLLAAGTVCVLPIPWCRQQQLVLTRRYVLLGAEAAILSLLAKNFRLRARLGHHPAHKRRRASHPGRHVHH